jgi:hypothetical protein
MDPRKDGIKNAVQVRHKCTAVFIESVAVFERFAGKPVWEGVVEVFDLKDCPEATRCYAWSLLQKGETQYVVILHRGHAVTPVTAVREFLMLSKV